MLIINFSLNNTSKNVFVSILNTSDILNISQEELSNKLSLLGITLYQSDIFSIEHNQRTVRDFELWGICKILEIKAEDLFEPKTK